MLSEKEASHEVIAQAIDQLMRQSRNYRAALASFQRVSDGRISFKEQILQLGKKI
jgi:ketosteroid isomerase-like protein